MASCIYLRKCHEQMHEEAVMTLVSAVSFHPGNCQINNLSGLQSASGQPAGVVGGGDEGRSCVCVQHWCYERVLLQQLIMSRWQISQTTPDTKTFMEGYIGKLFKRSWWAILPRIKPRGKESEEKMLKYYVFLPVVIFCFICWSVMMITKSEQRFITLYTFHYCTTDQLN